MRMAVLSCGSFLLGMAACLGLVSNVAPDRQSFENMGPTVQRIEALGLLTVMRVSIADVLIGEDGSHRGSWLVKGDAMLAVDCRRVELVDRDAETRRATIRLPPPAIIQPRLDHRKTRTWDIQRLGWIPWGGNEDKLRDEAMKQAQQLVEHAAQSPELQEQARSSASLLLSNMYRLVGWEVQVTWTDRRTSPATVAEGGLGRRSNGG